MINENTKIRPFLREYPFKANRFEIAITFSQKGYEPTRKDGSIVVAFQVIPKEILKLVYSKSLIIKNQGVL
jgi:hypothetical protein